MFLDSVLSLASFLVPGLGQVIRGRPLRAFFIALLASLWGWLCLQTIGFSSTAHSWLMLVTGAELGFRAVVALDAGRLPATESSLKSRWLMGLLLLAFYPVAVSAVNAGLLSNVTLGQTFYIPSESMLPTLEVGDYIAVDTHRRLPQRGDIVVFRPPSEGDALIKRVVALSGDRVEVRDGRLWINGIGLNEPYVKAPIEGDFSLHVVAPNCFFAMGDNRNNSKDSRYIGDIPLNSYIGKARWIFWSPDSARIATGLR